MKAVRLVMFTIALASAACGDDGGNNVNIVDANGSGSGSGSGTGDGGQQTACTAASSYTIAFADGGSAFAEIDDTRVQGFTQWVTAGLAGTADIIQIDFWAETGMTPALTAYPVAPDNTNYYDCTACVELGTQVNPQTGEYTDALFATGGTINLTNITGKLEGSLNNVTVTRSVFDDDAGTTTSDGTNCNSTISGSFSVTYEESMTARARTRDGRVKHSVKLPYKLVKN